MAGPARWIFPGIIKLPASFATGLVHFSESHEMPGEAINYTLRQPIGVVGCISWNLPLYLFSWKIAGPWRPGTQCWPALRDHPYTRLAPGRDLHGGRIASRRAEHRAWYRTASRRGHGHPPGHKAISFTGDGTRARIAATAAPMFRSFPGAGGKNPTPHLCRCRI